MILQLEKIHLDTTDSTNSYIQTIPVSDNQLIAVTAGFQTCGHGQKGNHWEAEKDKNLLLSMAFRAPFVPIEQQFGLSQALSLSIQQTVKDYLTPSKEQVLIKWPNDIYVGNRKICGFLVSCDLENTTIGLCVVGIGLNVNQETFTSDAPNPVSLKQIIHHDTAVEDVESRLIHYFLTYYKKLREGQFKEIAAAYSLNLYHRKGFHAYEDKDGRFNAEITDISPQGILSLRDESGRIRRYAFKEVSQFTD